MLENYKKSKKNIEARENPESQKPAGKTLADILKNQKESAMLAGFINRDGDTKLAERLALGQINESDIDRLEEYRVNNNEALQQVESLEKVVHPKFLQRIAESSPEFQKIINLAGVEKAAKVIHAQLQEVVVSDPGRFRAMFDSLMSLNEYESGTAKDFEKKVRAQCEKHGADDSEIAELLAIEDDDERDEAIRDHVKSQYGFFKKAGDFITRGKFSREAMIELSHNKEAMEQVSQDLDSHMKTMAESLHALVSGNEQVRTVFAKEIIEEKQVKKEPEPGFSEVKTEKQKIETQWNDFKSKNNFQAADSFTQDNLRNRFKQEAKQQHQTQPKKKGLWSRLWDNIFDRAVDDKELN